MAFVGWLKNDGLNKDAHWDLQTKLMLLPLAKYDAVVQFENFAAEMSELLRNLVRLRVSVAPSSTSGSAPSASPTMSFIGPS